MLTGQLKRLLMVGSGLAVLAGGVLLLRPWRWRDAIPPSGSTEFAADGTMTSSLSETQGASSGLLANVPNYDVNFTPAVPSYSVAEDLSNVEGGAASVELRPDLKALLVRHGFVLRPSRAKDFYDLYTANSAPFVSADCVFHAYHVLLADTLRNLEKASLADLFAQVVSGAHQQMDRIYRGARKELEPAAARALRHWAVAARLADAGVALHESVEAQVVQEVARIQAGQGMGKWEGLDCDYTVYQPIAGYEQDEKLARYFRLNRFLSLTPIPYRKDDVGAQAGLLVALAVHSGAQAWEAYVKLARFARFLAGAPEDATPLDFLAAARQVFGAKLSDAQLADPAKLAQFRAEVARRVAPPRVADQPQHVPGADASLGAGLRVLSGGVSLRALAFQALAEKTIPPRGEHVAHLLGNPSAGLSDVEKGLLDPLAPQFAGLRARFHQGLDIHSAALVTLARLSGPRKEGYPQFMQDTAWELKTENCQLGAWSEVEHDVFLYAKDNAFYSCTGGRDEGCHGYVEPVPEYFAALASLVAQTRGAFEQLGALKKGAPPKRDPLAGRTREVPIVATSRHYVTLEELALKLRDMAIKELQNELFDESEIKTLKEFGETLKYLSFDESNKSSAEEPISCIVRLVREYSLKEGYYFGVGRPLEIIAIVPWRGRLYVTNGGVFSYYQFGRPLAEALTDAEWKKLTLSELPAQPHPPFVVGKGLGLDAAPWSVADFRAWLPAEEKEGFGKTGSHGFLTAGRYGPPAEYARLDAEAVKAAGEAFRGHYGLAVRRQLYAMLKDAPPEQRAAIAVGALTRIAAEYGSHTDMDRALWAYLSLKLLEGVPPTPETKAAALPIRRLLESAKTEYNSLSDDFEALLRLAKSLSE